MKRRTLLGATGAATLPLFATAQTAPTYPSRQVTVVVAFAPGGLTDTLARRFARDLQAESKQTVVVETRAGASGQIASAFVARSAPDGHTLLVTATHHVINPAIAATLPYDTERDFIPVAELGSTPNILMVNPSLPVKNLKEYLALAAERKGGLAYATSGVGASTHLTGELLSVMTKTPLLHVPYKGVAPAATDVIGGQVPSLVGDVQSMMPFIRDGRLRPIAVGSTERSPVLPDVPTIAETVPGFEGISFIGLYAPAGVPPAVVAQINAAARRSMNSPETLEMLRTSGGNPGRKTSAEFTAFVNAEIAKWRRVVKEANVKVS